MAELTTKQRKKIPSKKFALEKERKYPIQDRAHAANAKARAKQMLDKGKLSKSKYYEIVREANVVLKKTEPKTKASTSKKRAVKKAVVRKKR